MISVDLILIGIVSVLCFIEHDMSGIIDSSLYYYMTLYQTFGMATLSIFFLIFGYAAQRKIWRTFTSSDGWRWDENFWRGLIRLNVIIVICFVCFTTKATLSYMIYGDSSINLSDNPLDTGTAVWTMLYEWIPDILPRLALLYLMSRNLTEEESQKHTFSVSGDGMIRSDTLSGDHSSFLISRGSRLTTDSTDYIISFDRRLKEAFGNDLNDTGRLISG